MARSFLADFGQGWPGQWELTVHNALIQTTTGPHHHQRIVVIIFDYPDHHTDTETRTHSGKFKFEVARRDQKSVGAAAAVVVVGGFTMHFPN